MKKPICRFLAGMSAVVLGLGVCVLPKGEGALLSTGAKQPEIVKIACIGASTVFGAGADNGRSWPDDLQKLLGGLCEVKNFGVNSRTVLHDGTETGDTTQKLAYTLTPQYTDSLAYQADVVLVMLGVNDSKPVNWKGGDNTFEEDYDALISAYRAQGNDPLVVYIRDPWVKGESWGITEDVVLNGVFPAQQKIVDKYSLPTIDLHEATKNHGEYYSDGVHPNNAGYQRMAELIAAGLKDMDGVIPEGSEAVPCPPSSTVVDFYGEYDGYDVMQFKNGSKGSVTFASGMLAERMGLAANTVVKSLKIELSYYWVGPNGANDWWHFNTNDKDGGSAPGLANGNPHDNGFGTFTQYGMVKDKWSVLTVTRADQLLGGTGADWYIMVGDLNAADSLYIRGYKWTATLADGTEKSTAWGTMKDIVKRGADDGETLKIACVGASTTTGTKGHSYPSYLQGMLGAACEVRNFGYPGCSVTKGGDYSYIGSEWYTTSLAYKADVVIIDMGVNDSQPGYWNGGNNHFKADYDELVSAYMNQGNQPLVLLSTGGHCTKPSWGTDDAVIANGIQPAQLEVAAKYDLPTADLRAVLMSDDAAYIDDEDGVHYTAAGYRAMAQLYYDALLPLITIPGDGGYELPGPTTGLDLYGEFDGYKVMQWKDGTTGSFSYDSGALAMAMGIDEGTVLKNLTIKLSYYWDGKNGANDWWHFSTTGKDGLSTPGLSNGKQDDNGFGTLTEYGLKKSAWSELVVSRDDQMLGGARADWYVNMGNLDKADSLYIRGFTVTATLADDTEKSVQWGVMTSRVDKTLLQNEVDDPINDLTGYTEETAAVYTAALNTAKAVLSDASATQEQIDEALTALKAAKDGLKRIEKAMRGDVDGDKKITTTDARLVLQFVADKIKDDALNTANAEVDGGEGISTTDARLILQHAAEKITEFPADATK